MAAPQGWSRWYDDAPEHPKFLAAGHKAGWLYVCGQAYCSRQATDGRIPKAIVPRLSDVPAPTKVATTLVEVGLWHDEGDHFVQHDYTEMQTTAAEREEKRTTKRNAGTRGNHQRWHVDRGDHDPSCPYCDSEPIAPAIAPATAGGSQRGSPETETETEVTPNPRRDPPGRDPDVSTEARTLTREFAVAVKANGHPVPTPDRKAHADWLVEMDRLLRIGPPGWDGDPPTVDEVRRVIAWTVADHFEKANVASVPKFRKRYSQLRLKALNATPTAITNVSSISEGGRF